LIPANPHERDDTIINEEFPDENGPRNTDIGENHDVTMPVGGGPISTKEDIAANVLARLRDMDHPPSIWNENYGIDHSLLQQQGCPEQLPDCDESYDFDPILSQYQNTTDYPDDDLKQYVHHIFDKGTSSYINI
jgi:hypothetical protein